MNYEQAVINVLLEAGDKGLPVRKIVLHVYNLVNSLFVQVEYKDIDIQVRKYIKTNSRNSYSTLERTEKRGYYRLNKNSEKFSQQKLHFEV